MSLCDGRVCVVTGAGRGIGREHALMLAAHGASVVVNDLGGALDGSDVLTGGGNSGGPAQDVVDEIVAAGGSAVANTDDVSSWPGARNLITQAIDTYGRLDVLVNNAGILRDRMLASMEESDWDAVMSVHLKGTFAPTRWAAAYWRDQSKAGKPVDARVVNTSSASGIYGNPGQSNYGAAKAGIAAFTIIASRELDRYGVTVNAVSPAALTRMTEPVAKNFGMAPEELAEKMSPRYPAAVVTWLASAESGQVTGRVIDVNGQYLAIAEGWHLGPTSTPVDDPTRIAESLEALLAKARPNATVHGTDPV